MQGGGGGGADNPHPALPGCLSCRPRTGKGGAGEIAHPAGYDRDTVPARRQRPGEFMMAGAPGFVQCGKGLVDEQDVHGEIWFPGRTTPISNGVH